MGNQRTHLVDFVDRHLVEPRLPFNATTSAGAHTPLILAAAKRRGLTVSEVDDMHVLLAGGQAVGSMRRMVTSLVSHVAVQACASKVAAKQLFDLAGVPTPRGVYVADDEDQAARRFLAAAAGPVVVKPDASRGGTGVTVGVAGGAPLLRALARARKASRPPQRVLVEEQHHGVDVRAYVIGGRLVAAASRLPPFVVGDGTSTLAQLVAEKRAQRLTSVYLTRTGRIEVDRGVLASQGVDDDTVPEVRRVVLLSLVANVHRGAETLDVTGLLCPDLRDLAERAASAIPGFGAGGVDLIVRSPETARGAVVLEGEAAANISVHHLPAYGEPVDVAGALVAEMVRVDSTRRRIGADLSPYRLAPEQDRVDRR